MDFPICCTCGAQYDSASGTHPARCKICDDPRQFVPPTGQTWTTLEELGKHHKNVWKQDEKDSRVWALWTEPKFAIGQRAFLLETTNGNVLWDLVSLLDEETVELVNSKGGLKAIVISHPHFYTTYVSCAKKFNCPVILSSDDEEWLCRQPPKEVRVEFIDGPAGTAKEVVPGVTAVKLGGHFPGSLVLHWERQLFIADTFVTVPSAYTPYPRPQGQTTYAFQWSIPNMIPLPPSTIHAMWNAIKAYDFDTTHGGFAGMDVRDMDLKKRLLDSMKIQIRGEGWGDHALLSEEV